MPLKLGFAERNGFCVADVAGDVDVATAAQLRGGLVGQIQAGTRKLVVDLTSLDFMDSPEHDGILRIVVPNERISKLFRITGLHRAMDLYPSLEAAVNEQVA